MAVGSSSEDKQFDIYHAKIIEDTVRHYYRFNDGKQKMEKGNEVLMKIDLTRRLLNSKYHTAAHLIADIIFDRYSTYGVKGHQFPNEAYIETNAPLNIITNDLQDIVNNVIASSLPIETYEIERDDFAQKFGEVPYFIPPEKNFRVCHIHGYKPVPCGGTHVSSTKDIGNIIIKKIANKDNKSKISYQL